MKKTNNRLKDRILLLLDRAPRYGYDLLKTLKEHDSTLIITTLYRWLHQMESQGLVASDVQPSPNGPPRRVYRVGDRGVARLREMMRDSLEIILHFYEEYSRYRLGCVCKLIPDDADLFNGRVLYSSCSQPNEFDTTLVRLIAKKCSTTKLHVLGDGLPTSEAEIPHRLVKGDLTDVRVPSGRYSLVWLNGVPEHQVLHLALVEIRRILADDGTLFITAPLTFFDEPHTPQLALLP